MDLRALLRGACVGIVCAAAALASAQLRYQELQPVLLHNGAGSAVFTVTNAGTTSLPLALRAGAFTDDTSQAPIAPPKLTLAWDTGSPLPVSIAPGATLRLQVGISGLSGASLASAPLFNGAVPLGRLEAIEADAPLNVAISEAGAGRPLVLARGDDATFTLTNNDGQSYPLDWAFQVGGDTLQSGELQLAAHGRAQIQVTPTDDLYTWIDNLRPSTRVGTLLLSLHGPASIPRELLPQRVVQVSLLMRKLSPAASSLWLHIAVALALLLGGLLSLFGNAVLPNIIRKITLRRQLNQLADRVSGVSTRIDPYLRTLLLAERRRLDFLLRRAWAISPGSGDALDVIASGMDRLRLRLKAAERLDELRRRLDQDSQSTPPSAIEDVDSKLRIAASHLHPLALTEDDVSAANRFLDAAEGSIAMLGDWPALAQMIAANFRELKVRQKTVSFAYYKDLYAALPGLFEMLNQPFDDPHNITRPMMFAIDYGTAAVNLAFDYAILRISTPATPPGDHPASGPRRSARERLLARHDELVNLLGTLSSASLRDLRALVQQMRENIYEQDVLEEIDTLGQAEIFYEPRSVRAGAPVVFALRFRDARFNDAAATRRLACSWDFPEYPIEPGWKVCHLFQGNETKRGEGRDLTVSARIESLKPAETAAGNGSGNGSGNSSGRLMRNTLSAQIELKSVERPSYSRAFAEGTRFLIAIGVALAGLFSGALQQLNRLDILPAMIAVLALGFGADTIKNLLVQTSKRASA